MNAEINQVRTELLNVMAEAGRAALHFDTMSAAALAAIPNTDPQQYVIAGTPPMIAKILPAVDVGSAVSTAVGEPVATADLPPLPERPKSMMGRTLGYSDDDMREYAVTAIAARLAAPTQVSAPQASAAQEVRAVPDLHNAIMNLRCDVNNCVLGGAAADMAYKMGHRDARHAAAELAIGYVPETSTSTAPAAMDEKVGAK